MSLDESMPNPIPRTAEVWAARAGLDAAADVLERMPNVDPYVVRMLRELSDDLLASRTTDVDRIMTWVPQDLLYLFLKVNCNGAQGPATILRQLELVEQLAPDRYEPFTLPDPAKTWIDEQRSDPDSELHPAVLDAVEARCRYWHFDLTISEVARHMRERVTYFARLHGAIDDFDQWKHTELPRLELEREIDPFPITDIPDDLSALIDARIKATGDTDYLAHLQHLRRQIEAWSAAADAWPVKSQRPHDVVRDAFAQFDEPVPPEWERKAWYLEPPWTEPENDDGESQGRSTYE